VIDAQAGELPLGIRFSVGIQLLRQAIGRRITDDLPGETGAIAKALITVERGGISAATNDAFRGSGLVHILAISGLHTAIMGGTVFFALRLRLAAIPAVALR
jgi:competence protein ComEC